MYKVFAIVSLDILHIQSEAKANEMTERSESKSRKALGKQNT